MPINKIICANPQNAVYYGVHHLGSYTRTIYDGEHEDIYLEEDVFDMVLQRYPVSKQKIDFLDEHGAIYDVCVTMTRMPRSKYYNHVNIVENAYLCVDLTTETLLVVGFNK